MVVKPYLPPAAALKKLNAAWHDGTPVYIFGATGYGKTALVQHFQDCCDVVWLSAKDPNWDLSFLDTSKTCTNVVVDDLQLLDDDRAEIIAELVAREDLWTVLIGRAPAPRWVTMLLSRRNGIIIKEEDLRLSHSETQLLFKKGGVALGEDAVAELAAASDGNGFRLSMALSLLQNGSEPDAELISGVEFLFTEHLLNHVVDRWSAALQEFMMEISVVDEFTLPLAITITGDDHAAAFIEEATFTDNFLTVRKNVFSIRPFMLKALRAKALKDLGRTRIRQFMNNAGLYYETQGDIVSALKMYEASGNKANILSLLIRNGRRHSAAGYYYELRRYYLELTTEEIESSPVLMSAMSMLYSILMNVEKSEYWYNQLAEHAKTAQGAERLECANAVYMLDFNLPHRSIDSIKDLMLNVDDRINDNRLQIPDICITNNQPSVMNGDKDFSDWSMNESLLSEVVGKNAERVLGKAGRGLLHLAFGENLFEQGGRDFESLYHIVQAVVEIEGGGTIENLFVATGIQVRASLIKGETDNAIAQLESFAQRAEAENAVRLLPNVRTMRCRIALHSGDIATIDRWMKEAPNERSEFCTLERFRYLCKIRCYMAKKNCSAALQLISMLRSYAISNNRVRVLMELDFLEAITLRELNGMWRDKLVHGLLSAQKYNFVRVVSAEGAAILPLLRAIRKEYLDLPEADAKWFKRTLEETEQVATRYPLYLGSGTAVSPFDFSENALFVLRKQAEGLSAQQIAAELGVTERTVKYHASENYRKLNAKGKTDAVQKARNLNIL